MVTRAHASSQHNQTWTNLLFAIHFVVARTVDQVPFVAAATRDVLRAVGAFPGSPSSGEAGEAGGKLSLSFTFPVAWEPWQPMLGKSGWTIAVVVAWAALQGLNVVWTVKVIQHVRAKIAGKRPSKRKAA